jgi:hypothetical protein
MTSRWRVIGGLALAYLAFLTWLYVHLRWQGQPEASARSLEPFLRDLRWTLVVAAISAVALARGRLAWYLPVAGTAWLVADSVLVRTPVTTPAAIVAAVAGLLVVAAGGYRARPDLTKSVALAACVAAFMVPAAALSGAYTSGFEARLTLDYRIAIAVAGAVALFAAVSVSRMPHAGRIAADVGALVAGLLLAPVPAGARIGIVAVVTVIAVSTIATWPAEVPSIRWRLFGSLVVAPVVAVTIFGVAVALTQLGFPFGGRFTALAGIPREEWWDNDTLAAAPALIAGLAYGALAMWFVDESPDPTVRPVRMESPQPASIA